MIVYADTHVHLYPCYNLTQAFESAWDNFTRASSDTTSNLFVLYLTERQDCHFFDQLAGDPESLVSLKNFAFEKLEIPEVLRIRRAQGGEMFLVSGRQIKTSERLEILVLHTREQFEDGLSFPTSLDAALEGKHLVVLNWSLGKWMFSRGKIVEAELRKLQAGEVQVGDIGGRPLGWGEPKQFELARSRKLEFVAGSDPLPFAGEEKKLASYLTRIECNVSLGQALSERWFFRDLLRSPAEKRSLVGKRNSWAQAGLRMLKNYLT